MTAAPLMTLQEAAESLGVHYMTVYRYVRQGRLPGVRHGTEWRLRLEDINALRSGGGRFRRESRGSPTTSKDSRSECWRATVPERGG